MIRYGVDTSHWNYPLDWKKLFNRLLVINSGVPGFVIMKVSQGISAYDDGIREAYKARNAGFEDIGAYHYFSLINSPASQAERFLKQDDGFNYTIRHSLDLERTAGESPSSKYPNDVYEWYRIVDAHLGAPGMFYSSLSWINTYFKDWYWQSHSLWLSQPPSTANYQYLLGAPNVPLPFLTVRVWQRSFYNFIADWMGSEGGYHLDLDVTEDLPMRDGTVPEPPTDPPPDPPPPETRQARCIMNSLNIRTGPGTQYPSTGKYLSYGMVVDVLASSVPELGSEWIKHTDGWSCHHTSTYVYMEDL